MEDPQHDQEERMNDADNQSETSEDEEECRVCRGPAEEGRPLYAPCKCSGSIGLTHQDCLASWLAVTRGSGQCELCGMKFQFAPKYKEGAPDKLGFGEVILGLCSRTVEKWMPLALRIAVAVALWLGAVPLTTTYLYHGWMHRPSSVITRLKWELVPGDLVSGIVISTFIIITFLSFMSFADFLRFNWQQGAIDGRREDRQHEELLDVGNGHDAWDFSLVQLEIINHLKRSVERAERNQGRTTPIEGYDPKTNFEIMRELVLEMESFVRPGATDIPSTDERKEELRKHTEARDLLLRLEELEGTLPERRPRRSHRGPRLSNAIYEVIDEGHLAEVMEDELRQLEVDLEEEEVDDDNNEEPHPMEHVDDVLAEFERLRLLGVNNEAQGLRFMGGNNEPHRNDRRNIELMDPLLQPGQNPDDDVDMDINVALDELLGLRGPFNILIRNVFWLLAFNTTYLGLFAFIPKNFGSSVYSIAFNRTGLAGWINITSPEGDDDPTLGGLMSVVDEESKRLDTTLRLPDLATITLGYLSMALLVVLVQAGVFLYAKMAPPVPPSAGHNADMNGHPPRRPQRAHPAVGEEAGGVPRDEGAFLGGMDEREMDEMVGGLGEQLSIALDCLKALTKVGFLLFHKMLLLPLLLGVWLDTATLSFFGSTQLERAIYAGGDLFSSALLHWVVGITFMLFVTVSVLQLREVAHPGLLARVIRPQEPQPDLLSNLLHESLATHAKRMLLSFIIYAALLSLHVWLPARIFVATGLGRFMPFARMNFAHVLMPQLQVPFELLIFHLTMLALLEKYKNRIGEMQHSWLKFLCNRMGLTEYVLPRWVAKFVLVGSRPLLLESASDDEEDDGSEDGPKGSEPLPCDNDGSLSIDPFWYELAGKDGDVDAFILANVKPHPLYRNCRVRQYRDGVTRQNGKRMPRNEAADRIVLPPPSLVPEIPISTSKFLPTSIGSFRLCKRTTDDEIYIEFWREIPGDPIPRPPEGWDDLGVGGAEVQGRWAWGKEKKSAIENGVAQRSRFFGSGKSRLTSLSFFLKGTVVFFLSWLVITVVACLALACPLVVGRAIHTVLRVPDRYVHDPFAFAVGICLWSPFFSLISGVLWGERSMWRRFLNWVSKFYLPPMPKLRVVLVALFVWLGLSPLLLGTLYELMFLKGPPFWSSEPLTFEPASLAMSWATGTLLLNAWALLCYYKVFSWEFWVNVGNAALEAEIERERQPQERNRRDAAAAPEQPELPMTPEGDCRWQGQYGRIWLFFNSLKVAVFHGEWDVVNGEVLLHSCAFPVLMQLCIALAMPCLVYALWIWLHDPQTGVTGVPYFGELDNALFRTLCFRVFCVACLVGQMASSNQEALRRWFQAAHKAARDGRYLEGEILLNYEPGEANSQPAIDAD